jgi:hypothetical protein
MRANDHRLGRRFALGIAAVAIIAVFILDPFPLSAASSSAAPGSVADPATINCQLREPRQNPAKSPDLHPRFTPDVPLPIRGPCAAADSFAMIPPQGALPAVYGTNFGVLFDEGAAPADAGADAATGRRRYGFTCEENFGGKLPDHLARHPDGRLFIAGFDGLHVADDATNNCSFVRAAGSVAWLDVAEIAFDPVAPSDAGPAPPRRIYALSRNPAVLHVSLDDGRTFSRVHSFAPEMKLLRLFVAAKADPPGSRTIYAAGSAAGVSLLLARSEDDGANFTSHSFVSADFGRAGVLTVVEGPSPGAPGTLFLASGGVSGADEIWRSTDGGQTWAKVLTLLGTETRAGFTFGASGNDVFVAGREFTGPAGSPASHLYVSHDGGATFATTRPSSPAGPRYRCLAAAEGRLYACGDPSRDLFMFGVSDDEGATWTPTVTLTDIVGPRACTRGRCAATAFWLCQSYGICPDDPQAPEQRDAQAADGVDVDGVDRDGSPDNPKQSSGCGCRVGAGPSDGARSRALVFLTAASSLAAARAVRRRRRALARRSS